MARTILVIYDALIDEKENRTELDLLQPNPDSSQTFLDDLTSTSKVAIWRLFLFVVAVGIWTFEKILDLHTAAVEKRGSELITTTTLWLVEESKLFQLGDTLVFVGNVFQYAVIDESKQIIERAAATESPGQVTLKVAKLVGIVPTKLSASELTAFNSYINRIKSGGQRIQVVSRDPDEIKLFYKVVYDPQVMAANGSLLSDPGTFPAVDAINGYISELPFDGTFNVTQQTDAIQLATGVVDPVYQSSEARFGSNPFVAFTENYIAQAGHMIIDPLTPLSGSITYVADV